MDLYQITSQFKDAKEKLDDMLATNEIDNDCYQDTLSSLNYDFDQKALDIARYIKELTARKKALEDALKEMDLRKNRFNNMIDKLNKYLKVNMETLNKTKIKGFEFDVSLRRNPPKLVINEDDLDEKWYTIKTQTVVDKKRLKEACKNNMILGAKLIQENRIEIK